MITYSQSIFFLKFLANRVRKYAKEFELNEAVKLAVDECIRNNILSEFLRKNKAEVIAMSIFEYDKEEEERKLRKAEYEAGVAAGMKDGMKAGIKAGVADGISKGKILAKKEDTIALSKLGLPVEQIASARRTVRTRCRKARPAQGPYSRRESMS